MCGRSEFVSEDTSEISHSVGRQWRAIGLAVAFGLCACAVGHRQSPTRTLATPPETPTALALSNTPVAAVTPSVAVSATSASVPSPTPIASRSATPQPVVLGHPLILKGATTPVTLLAWSPDGSLLATAGAERPDRGDHAIRLWHEDGTLAATLKGHTDAVTSLAWSPDGKILSVRIGGQDRAVLDRGKERWKKRSPERTDRQLMFSVSPGRRMGTYWQSEVLGIRRSSTERFSFFRQMDSLSESCQADYRLAGSF